MSEVAEIEALQLQVEEQRAQLCTLRTGETVSVLYLADRRKAFACDKDSGMDG